ncbi:MAG: thiocyanate hydrolase [Actinomycetia bacterium]|nr:thiocyanate hydrolase [Actinomycetes bacterium]
MDDTGNDTVADDEQFALLQEIAERNQTWSVMATKYGVDNPLPPWKTSLDGFCDALDRSCAAAEQLNFTFTDRRDEEDELSATRYANVPFPESQLISLAHSLLARGVIDETELRRRLDHVRARLES